MRKNEKMWGGIESEERRERREKEREAGRRNVKTESETKRERKGSEVDQRCPDLISVEDVMMVRFLFICQVQRERRRKIGSYDVASGQRRELLKDHYHLLPLRSCCYGGITLVMRPT